MNRSSTAEDEGLDYATLDALRGDDDDYEGPLDFRRSLSTALHERFKVAPHVVEVILGHAGGHKAGVTGTYNRSLYLDERRHALDLWAQHILGLVEHGRKS
jgi:hypothetical protein